MLSLGRRNQCATKARRAAEAMAQARSSRRFRERERAETGLDESAEAAEEMDFSSRAMSRADCQRSSGSFAKQRRMACSKVGGGSVLIVLVGAGSSSKMADA